MGDLNEPATGVARRACELARGWARPIDERPLATGRQRGLLELRIAGHMRMVGRALDQIRELNPKRTPRDELPEEKWDSLAWRGDRALIDLVDSEVRFWAALIENNPMIHLGEDDERWIARVVRLAGIIKESEERRRRDLAFLRDRFVPGSPGPARE